MNNIIKRISAIALCGVILLGAFSSLPSFANSAQTYFEGVDSTGAIMPDSESPVIVEKEVLTFDISEFPNSYYYETAEFEAYNAKVTAEYTFYNPSKYKVTSKLLFPFGNKPHYAAGEQDDTEKFNITVNGEVIEKKIRYTLSDMYSQFELSKDLSLISDGYAEHEFYDPDLPVTVYKFSVNQLAAKAAAFDLKKGNSKTLIYIPGQSGGKLQYDDDLRVLMHISNVGRNFVLYAFGEPLSELPDWKLYKDEDCEDGEELQGNVELITTYTTTFKKFALSYQSEDSPVSEIDWYNAVIAELDDNKDWKNYNIVRSNGLEYNFDRRFMRWYEYEITLSPGQRLVNKVTAPMYPAIDLSYEPSIYEYTYLLSPAKTWSSFGELEIIINTPYYLTECALDGFEKTDKGYKLTLSGLPDEEMRFTLSTGEKPKRKANTGILLGILMLMAAGGGIIMVLGILAVWAIIVAIVVIVVLVNKNKKRKNGGI